MRTEREITIEATPEAVFRVISDPETHLVWRPLAVEFRPLDGDELEPGGRVVETTTFFGNRYTTVYEVEALDSPTTLQLRSLQGPVHAELSYLLEPENGGTHLTLTLDAEPPPRFRLFGLASRWYLDDGAKRLKALIEEDRAPVPRWFNYFAAFCIALFALLLTLGVAYTAFYEDPIFAVASSVAAISLWIVAYMLFRGRRLGGPRPSSVR